MSNIVKVLIVLALVTVGIMIAPIALGILAAILPVAIGGFAIIFPILAIGALVGWFLKKKE